MSVECCRRRRTRGQYAEAQSTETGEAQFGLLPTAKKEALQQRCRTYDAVGWFLPSLRAKLLALQLKFVHGEHHRAPQDRQASEPAALGLRPAV